MLSERISGILADMEKKAIKKVQEAIGSANLLTSVEDRARGSILCGRRKDRRMGQEKNERKSDTHSSASCLLSKVS
ncbi:MAG: hypothetical protein D3905_16605 [Candidatus Electrothrix sp. AS4_5]|nr:hypothetical protein [Candidatus Electrothrix gigas]